MSIHHSTTFARADARIRRRTRAGAARSDHRGDLRGVEGKRLQRGRDPNRRSRSSPADGAGMHPRNVAVGDALTRGHPQDRRRAWQAPAPQVSARRARRGHAGFCSPKFLEYRRRGQRMSSLNPDREMLAQFAGLMFKHARRDGFVSLRAFPDKSKKEKAIFVDPIRIGDGDFLDITTERARQAAAWHVPAVFCPPVATFRDHKNAKTDNLYEGVCLSVECDQRPLEARRRLKPCSALLPPSLRLAANGQTPRPARSSRKCICTGG